MVTVGLFVRLEARPGKENEVENFLKSAGPLVSEEPGTLSWYAIRLGPRSFGIFDTFADDAARNAHLSGRIAAALMARADELCSKPPAIESVDVLAAESNG